MPPVVIVGTKTEAAASNTLNPLQCHDTGYPFRRSDVENPESEVVRKLLGGGKWRHIYRSAHKAEMQLTSTERKVVNDATNFLGRQKKHDEDRTKGEGNFR